MQRKLLKGKNGCKISIFRNLESLILHHILSLAYLEFWNSGIRYRLHYLSRTANEMDGFVRKSGNRESVKWWLLGCHILWQLSKVHIMTLGINMAKAHLFHLLWNNIKWNCNMKWELSRNQTMIGLQRMLLNKISELRMKTRPP